MSAEVSATEALLVDIKLPKNCKEVRYYYRNREEILEKRRLKKLEDPEYKAKVKDRESKKAEREALEQEKSLKRELKKQALAQFQPSTMIPSGAIQSSK